MIRFVISTQFMLSIQIYFFFAMINRTAFLLTVANNDLFLMLPWSNFFIGYSDEQIMKNNYLIVY